MSPPLAFDGESDTSAATCSNGSPATTRLRMSSALAFAASSAAAAALDPVEEAVTRISRIVTVPGLVNSAWCSAWYFLASCSVTPTFAMTSFWVTRAISIWRSSDFLSSAVVSPSCFSAVWNASSLSSLFSFRMFWTTRSKSSSVIL